MNLEKEIKILENEKLKIENKLKKVKSPQAIYNNKRKKAVLEDAILKVKVILAYKTNDQAIKELINLTKGVDGFVGVIAYRAKARIEYTNLILGYEIENDFRLISKEIIDKERAKYLELGIIEYVKQLAEIIKD